MGCSTSSDAQKASLIAKPSGEELEVNAMNTVTFLGKVALFQSFADQDRQRVADSCTHAGFKPGEAIIMSGEVSVRFKPPNGPEDKVAALEAGDYFGEAALLKNIPRAATIVA